MSDRRRPRGPHHPASTLAAILTGLAAGVLLVALGVRMASAEPAPPPTPPSITERLRVQLAAERVAHREQVRDLRVTLNQRAYLHRRQVAGLRRTLAHRPSVDHALRLAATTTGVPLAELRAVARCESQYTPTAQHPGSGAAGLMQFMAATWAAYPFGRAGWSRFDPYASAMQAALIVKVEGWRQWVCKP